LCVSFPNGTIEPNVGVVEVPDPHTGGLCVGSVSLAKTLQNSNVLSSISNGE
jgi:ribosome-binding ATPase YchF (GTP1/OBG family)